jgi:hydrogenase maturation protein HypF
MSGPLRRPDAESGAVEIRVRGRVQGVGLRPAIWRMARDLELSGEVRNDEAGVLIHAAGARTAIAQLIARLERDQPVLARIAAIEVQDVMPDWPAGFRIAASAGGAARTEIAPDARICAACADEILDPFERRFRYPFASCTDCGPRFSIASAIPYDRAATAMAGFALCDACTAEYRDPADRRYHAEAMACHRCGPTASLVRCDGRATSFDQHSLLDDVDAVCGLLHKGQIVAIKGIGGFQLACDATAADAVARLRTRKQRDRKPFALMARDLAVIRRYCTPTDEEVRLLESPEAPIVLLRADHPELLPEAVAPGMGCLGFMLPTSPLHVLALRRMDRPAVMTSGNLSDAPPILETAAALRELAGIADYALIHDRPIVNRVDDSVVRVIAQRPVVLRRARGFAPGALALPDGFAAAPELLAYGGELKATFCLVKDGQALLSPHIGDLENAPTLAAFEDSLAFHGALFAHRPAALAADLHPEYLSTKLAHAHAAARRLPLIEVQHHHAHVAACLVDNGRALEAPAVLGIVLDGLGWGDDGTLWGGEFLLADYRAARRLATLKPVPMLGGAQAVREPWRSLYAHLRAEISWAELTMNFAELPLHRFLDGKPRATLDAMARGNINAPPASSCGRLFDAVAAALDICRDRQSYEGEAAMRLEAIVCARTMAEDDTLAYPFAIPKLPGSGLPYLEPLAMWHAVLGDLILDTPAPVMAARFHKGLARAVAALAHQLAHADPAGARRFDTVALSGGCCQNAVLMGELVRRLEADGFAVLRHALVPPNDGGLALGQAAVAAARLIDQSGGS